MNILITIDNNYLDIAMNMLYSLKMHNDGLIIHLIYDNLSKESLDILDSFIKDNNIGELKTYYFDTKDKNLVANKTDYITNTTYFRMFAPYIIEDVDRILYLDPDIICQGSIKELYNTDLEGNILGAAINMIRSENEFYRKTMIEEIALPKDSLYFNGGVLLIDMKKYRSFLSLDRLTHFLDSVSSILPYHDQDAINKLFNKKIKIIDNKYNYQINAADFWNLNYDKVLIHYSESAKPWKDDYSDIKRALPYYKFLHSKNEDDKLRELINKHSINYGSMIYDKIINNEM